jgi:hypothetical protein
MVHPTGFLSLLGEKIGVAETLWTYTREVLGLNLGDISAVLTFRVVLLSFQANAGIVPLLGYCSFLPNPF